VNTTHIVNIARFIVEVSLNRILTDTSSGRSQVTEEAFQSQFVTLPWRAMATAVFTTKVNPTYDDLPEVRYHFPKTYLNQARQAVGDWIVYYEPRREGADLSGRSGRQCYFATARVNRIEQDRSRSDHFYAYISDYLEFTNPVPFREGVTYHESSLRKQDGSTNKGQFGRALRLLLPEEYQMICRLGFADKQSVDQHDTAMKVAEDPIEYGRPNRVQLLERPFRDAAFTRLIQNAYESTCAMTGLKLINGGGRCEIEAAHIRPVADDGPDSPRNGIALSRTVHWMFDRGILSISDAGEILMSPKLVPDPVRRMLHPDGNARFPATAAWSPHPSFLRYHREHFFKGN
jgi:putative restriction endonuclease